MGNSRRVIGLLVAGSMVFSSTAALAAAAPPPATQPDPWAVLSVMSGGASAIAACGAASFAAAAAQPAPGCVLPQVDVAAPAPPPPPTAIPAPPVETEGGLGISPLLIGLALIAAGVALYFILHKRHHHANSPA